MYYNLFQFPACNAYLVGNMSKEEKLDGMF